MYTTPVGEKKDIDATIEAYEEPWRLAQFQRRERDCVHIRKHPAEELAHGSELEGIEGYSSYRATGRTTISRRSRAVGTVSPRLGCRRRVVMCRDADKLSGLLARMKNHYNELCCTAFWLF